MHMSTGTIELFLKKIQRELEHMDAEAAAMVCCAIFGVLFLPRDATDEEEMAQADHCAALYVGGRTALTEWLAPKPEPHELTEGEASALRAEE